MKRSANQKVFGKGVKLYLDGKADVQQQKMVNNYYDLFSNQPDVLDSLNDLEIQMASERLKNGINRKIVEEDEEKPVPLYKRYIFQVAAVILLVSGIFAYRLLPSRQQMLKEKIVKTSSIIPGSNKAILTLSDGSSINLTNSMTMEVANESGISIMQGKTGKLVYNGKSVITNGSLLYNKISTSNGGQYQVLLSDGTKVWLNAASSLRYPVLFGADARKVELTGEAYFEVSKDAARPFKVTSRLQQVEVIGTHFNVNAYADEHLVKTTLLQGSVKVHSLQNNTAIAIKPGQESLISDDHKEEIKVQQVDAQEAVAWKNGYFSFNGEPLESVLKKVSRWYDVDIVYQSTDNKQQLFSGTLSKYSDLSKVLKKLELTEAVHFSVEGRSIIVMK